MMHWGKQALMEHVCPESVQLPHLDVVYMSLVGRVVVADYLPMYLTELSTEGPITPSLFG